VVERHLPKVNVVSSSLISRLFGRKMYFQPTFVQIDGSILMDLLIEYGAGVRTPTVEVLELGADAFAQT
jgi:restriction endonuclease Mrr